MNGASFNTSYEPFSDRPEYLELNRGFISDIGLGRIETALDLACGTGNLAAEILRLEPTAAVVGLDLSRESLAIARTRVGGRNAGESSRLLLVEGSADRLPLAAESFDVVVMGNAIHNLPDLDLLLDEVARVLRPGGIFAFNTSFYAGTFAPGTERFYLQWMKEALRWAQKNGHGGGSSPGSGPPRTRGTRPRSAEHPWLSAGQYEEALARHGFMLQPSRERPIEMCQESFESVGSYAGLAEVLLSGYPVELACHALQATARPALEAVGLDRVSRLWLEVAGAKA
ncbi:MAG: class I SAM-dependent methyltransferase [Thermoanaerobaculales bacterium]|jgi:SAM-dependent methyltransferase|nr:class I SAM-dependent methyltransferase [Thermoanaerobaculales bacterium]